jgi:hypothetical protein
MRIWVSSARQVGVSTSYGYDTVTHKVYKSLDARKEIPAVQMALIPFLWADGGRQFVRSSSVRGAALYTPSQVFARPTYAAPTSLGEDLSGYTSQSQVSFTGNQGGYQDPLDELAYGMMIDMTPAEQGFGDFEDFPDMNDMGDWFAGGVEGSSTDLSTGALMPVASPIGYNTAFGHVTWTNNLPENVGRGADRVPVVVIEATVTQNAAYQYHDVITVATQLFALAYQRALAGRPSNANDYAQIRLLRPDGADSFFDIVSDLTPYYETVADFQIAFELLLQSENNRLEQRNGGFLTQLLEMNFVFTFVLADDTRVGGAGVPTLTVNNIGEVRQKAASFASNVTQRAHGSNLVVSRNRFIMQHQDHVSSRATSLSTNFTRQQGEEFLAARASVESRVNWRKRPLPVPSDLADLLNPNPIVPPKKQRAPPSRVGKRAYTPRRSAEDIAAIRLLGEEVKDIANYRVVDGVAQKIGRARRVWTAQERAAYNLNRRQKYKDGKGEVRGIYDDLKRKIFHHASIEKFYQHSKAVLEVPNSWDEGYCLAMAFMKAECRTYASDGSATRETLPYAIQPEHGEYATAPILSPFVHLIDQDCDFITGDAILLFNPYKYSSGEEEKSLRYALKPPDSVIRNWYQAAQNVHLFVSQEVGMELDPNSEASLQAYADVFHVHIALYNQQVRGKRTVVIRPSHVPNDLRKTDQFRVVSLLISEEHCSAITNLRAFLKSNASANRASLHNYCIFCEKMSTSNNQTAAEAKEHFNTCINKKDGVLCCNTHKAKCAKTIRNIHPPQFLYDTKTKIHKCRLCQQPLEHGVSLGQIHHVCYMDKEKKPKMGDGSLIYVYDFECEQVRVGTSRTFVHRVNLVCVRRIYPDENGDFDRHCFATLEAFMEYVMSHSMVQRVYLAHNGSKYDVQFIVKHLEKNMIPHEFIPAPSSMHAYLRVSISFGAKAGVTFLDFRHFMPGSLKNIAISFGLSLQKGDFPHHFNNGAHADYCGRIPLLDHEDDYWCLLSKRSEEEVSEFREWYAQQSLVYCTCDGECSCMRKKWDFQEEITRYCWLDVDVLAEASSRYRDWAMAFGEGEDTVEGWSAKPVDPFQYLTIPQLAMTTLMGGLPEEENITITPYKMRTDRVPLAIAWMERMQRQSATKIHHLGNWHKEYLEPATQRFVDGITDDMHVYVCLNCTFHACPFCFHEEVQTGVDHPSRPGTYGRIAHDTREFLEKLFSMHGRDKTHIVWEHELTDYSEYEKELGKVMVDREMFKGGRTEVFSPFCNADQYPEDDIRYFDVCSLYPFVCAFTELPTGHPEHLCGADIDRARLLDGSREDRYAGFVRCRVIPNREDRIGLLPCHDPKSGRLEFPLDEMTGSWGTEELRLAYENGYQVQEVFEVYHWSKEERSDTFMRGYVSFFLRMKQEAEGWRKLGASCDEPNAQEQTELVETLFHENGGIGRIRPELVRKNPINRALAKTFLNSLWGKFCQRAHTDHYSTIHGYAEFSELWNDPHLDRRKVSFRHLSHGTWKVKYHLQNDFAKENPRYNIFVAAKVTESARCILHKQMLKIGPERILYCDTDSIMFLWPKTGEKLDAHGLGKWVDEYPRQAIKRLYALAPKFYYLEFETHGGPEDALLKSKGIMMNWTNRALLNGKTLGKQLLELLYPTTNQEGGVLPFQGHIPMKNVLMGIHTTSAEFEYGTMLTKETNDKKLRPVLTKRHLVPYLAQKNVPYDETSLDSVARMYTIPKGYYRSVENMSALLYNE